MKVLFFTRYTRLGASSRLRFYQFFPRLEERGLVIDVSPLFNDKYLLELYSKRGINKWNIISSYANRFLELFKIKKYDLVVIEKELFPYLPSFVEYVLSKIGVKYIVDFDDAIFHNYDAHPSKAIRILLGRKIETVMKASFAVVVGNKYLSDYAVQAGAAKVVEVPTVIDTARYKVKKCYSSPETIIGWIGSPSTVKYIKMLKPVLQMLCKKYPIKLHIVGGKTGIGLEEFEEILEWSESEEVEMIRCFDIGIMPLQDNLWEYGKCGYKLIQYMGCAIPVVGSPVGINNIIIRDGVNGFKPVNVIEWEKSLEALVINESLRKSMGEKGRNIVEAEYSLMRASEDWYKLLQN